MCTSPAMHGVRSELPPSPPSRVGWPWTVAASSPLDRDRVGPPLPRVSIITPSYNQAAYLEETIRSVLLQDYANLEYIVIDGNSTDGSVDIIRRYEDQVAYWISEPDQGQADALQKGFARATGDIVAYLNSDDVYLPSAIATAVSVFQADPGLCVVSGDMRFIDATGNVLGHMRGIEGDFFKSFLQLTNPIPQPSAFVRRDALEAAGGIDPGFHMLMDYDLWCRIGLRNMKIQRVPADLSLFRIHLESKTRSQIPRFAQERWRLVEKYLADPDLGPELEAYKAHLYATAHLHIAAAHWLCDERAEAYSHYWDAIRMAPRLLPSYRSLSLLSRFITRRRSYRGRFAEHVAPD